MQETGLMDSELAFEMLSAIYAEAVGCDGIIVTKLDGTAKGGVIIAVAEELGLPVEYIGLGEGVDDLQPFDAEQFARALFE